jgi:hypothetical protein
MAASAGTKTKTKKAAATGSAAKTKAKRPDRGEDPAPESGTSERKKESNWRNAQKSTGPRTAEGKRNSLFNAVTHGLTARTVLLPGEDPSELTARQQQLIDTFQPCHEAELAIVERMAADIWRSDRAERGAAKRIAAQLRHEPVEQAAKEQHEALELGGRLFWQLSFPLPISEQSPKGKVTEPPCSAHAIHPHHPARLRLQLEQTVAGSEWLIDRWSELMNRFFRDEFWLTSDAFKMVRLMGKHAIDMADDLDVLSVFLATLTLNRAHKVAADREAFDWKSALVDMLLTFELENQKGVAAAVAKQCEPFARRLAELPLAKLAPRDEDQARERLNAIIDLERSRLMEIRMVLLSIGQADAAEAPARLAFETGTEGDRQRRYGLSNERLVIRRFSEFLRTRSMIASGTFEPTEMSVVSGPLSVPSEPSLDFDELSRAALRVGVQDLSDTPHELAPDELTDSKRQRGHNLLDVPVHPEPSLALRVGAQVPPDTPHELAPDELTDPKRDSTELVEAQRGTIRVDATVPTEPSPRGAYAETNTASLRNITRCNVATFFRNEPNAFIRVPSSDSPCRLKTESNCSRNPDQIDPIGHDLVKALTRHSGPGHGQ